MSGSAFAARPRVRARTRRLLAIVAAAVLTTGCAPSGLFSTAEPAVEISDAPFFPQTDYQCGPAALATILAHEQVPVTADDLTPAVYVAGLRGSLQAELLGATRRHGLIAYVIAPEPAALIAEVSAGRPVLVLQNLGLRSRPIWHYAVVVGFDPERDRVILRSGEQRRRMESARRFLRSWDLADNWGFVALRPGVIPASDDSQRYVRALADAEAVLPQVPVISAYTAALAHWPNDALVAFAAANQHFTHDRLEQAATLYRLAIDRDPAHAAAHGNLAHVLAQQGCATAAIEHAQAALALTEAGSTLHAAIRSSVDRIASAATQTPDHECR